MTSTGKLAREVLSVRIPRHQTFFSYDEWLTAVLQRGFVIVRASKNGPDVGDLPFDTDLAYSARDGDKIEGACFVEGISFGWLREHRARVRMPL